MAHEEWVLIQGMGLSGVWGLMFGKSSNSSAKCSGSDSSLEYSFPEE